MALSEIYNDVFIADNELSVVYLPSDVDITVYTSNVVEDTVFAPIVIDEVFKL